MESRAECKRLEADRRMKTVTDDDKKNMTRKTATTAIADCRQQRQTGYINTGTGTCRYFLKSKQYRYPGTLVQHPPDVSYIAIMTAERIATVRVLVDRATKLVARTRE